MVRARLQAEYDDIVAALRWLGDSGDRRAALRLAVSLLWYWMLSGGQDEARTWIEFALDVEGEADPTDLLIGEGLRALTQDGEDLGGAVAERVEREYDGQPLLALARPVLALISGDTAVAETRLAETLEHPDPWVRTAALMMRAQLAENTGDQAHMRADLERAASGFRELGDSWALAMTLSSQAGALMIADQLDEAETVLDEATERFDALDESSGMAFLWLRLGEIRLRRGDIAGAREVTLRAVEDADLRRDESVFVRGTLARIALLAGDLDAFRELIADAAARLERIGEPRADRGHAAAFVGALQAVVALEDGDLERAATLIDAALSKALATSDMPLVASIGTASALISLRAGRAEDAAEQLGAAAVLRGAEDRSSPEVARLLEALAGFEAAYERGRRGA